MDAPPRSAASAPAHAGLELRLERERATIRLAGERVARDLVVEELALEVPRDGQVDVSAGPSQFRSELGDLDRLALRLEPDGLAALAARLAGAEAGFSGLALAWREGFVELAGAVDGAPFTARAAVVPGEGEGLRLLFHAPALYAPSAVPAGAVATRLARSAAALGDVSGAWVEVSAVREALLRTLPRAGFKLPRRRALRLEEARVAPDGARLAWARWASPLAAPTDPDLVAALDGAHAFAGPEELLARDEAAGCAAWRALPPAARAHPFAAARLLSILVADLATHGEARALARAWLGRHPEFAPALLAEALVALAAGELAAASVAFSSASRVAARRGERFAAIAAADACAACGEQADPGALSAALEGALALRRDHVPALRALAALAGRAGDVEGQLRAARGLAAHAPDARERGRAQARLAQLLADRDGAAARLHLANARRLAPDDPETEAAADRLASR